MEVSCQKMDVKPAGVKRKAAAEDSRSHKKQPTKLPKVDDGIGKLPAPGMFLNLKEVIQISRHPKTILESVPLGRKSDLFYIVDDSINALKRERDEPVKYHDDCGQWTSKDFTRNFYVQNDVENVKKLKKRDNLFYKESHVKGGSFLSPLNPQPDPNTILTVSRRTFQSSSHNYKKRITAVSGNNMKSVAVIEYIDTKGASGSGCVPGTDEKGTEEKSTTITENHKDFQETEKKCAHEAENSSNLSMNSKNVQGADRNIIDNTEKSSGVAVSSEQALETDKSASHTAGQGTNIAVNSKHVPEVQKKIVPNVVKRLRGRSRLTKVHNVVKRPRGRPRLNKVQNVIKRPRGRPPKDRVKNGDAETSHQRIKKIHARLRKQKYLVPKDSKASVKPAFETQKELVHPDKKVPVSAKRASRTPAHAVIRMSRDTAIYDEDFLMVGMLEENPTVQEVISRKSKPPCVILYHDKQFSDMKRNLECENVLGVDCTHKFGDCYVTVTVYQNSRALHRDTNEPLLFLGPVYLHWDQECLTYSTFFSHLMDKLEGIELNIEVKLGNDVGLPLFKALKCSFPTSTYLLDCHHLKETLYREFLDIVSGKPKLCSAILDQIFGEEGIIYSSCLSAFENGFLDLACYLDEFPKLKSYFDHLQSLLYPYVCAPYQRGISQKLWVKGNDDILNDQFLTMLKCKDNKISDIIENVCAITKMQMLELKDV